VQLDAAGRVNISAAEVNAGSSDDRGIASLAVSPDTFTCDDIGPNTVTLTATDTSGNVSTCTATVMVLDTTPPEVRCKDITVQLCPAGSTITITADQITDGSSDNCGIASMIVNPSNFSKPGVYSVTLIATDTSKNATRCTATVTVEKCVLIELDQFTAVPQAAPQAASQAASQAAPQAASQTALQEAPQTAPQAAPQDGHIVLTWSTLSEIDTDGFNLWRSEVKGGEGKAHEEESKPGGGEGNAHEGESEAEGGKAKGGKTEGDKAKGKETEAGAYTKGKETEAGTYTKEEEAEAGTYTKGKEAEAGTYTKEEETEAGARISLEV